MATPHVAGVASLLLSEEPGLSAEELKDLILIGVDSLPDLEGKTLTGGRLNAFNSLSELGPPAELIGTPDDDIISGTNRGDFINGLGGNDILEGRGGDDEVLGGSGNDDIGGGSGNDSLSGEGGRDRISGGSEEDILSGRNNPDTLIGGSDNDALDGGNGNDLLIGVELADSDSQFGTNEVDTLAGGGGRDTSVLGDSLDTELDLTTDEETIGDASDLDDSSNELPATTANSRESAEIISSQNTSSTTDISDLPLASQSVDDETDAEELNLNADGEAQVGFYDMSFEQGNPNQEAPILAAGFEPTNIFTLSSEELSELDVLFVQNPDNSQYGEEYLANLDNIEQAVENGMTLIIHDRIDGGAGSDRLLGESGNDTVNGGDAKDTILGGADSDLLSGDAGRDQLFGGAEDDTLNGGNGNDTLTGGFGNDSLAGDAGNDRLVGVDLSDPEDELEFGAGEVDILTGGTGHNTFVLGNESNVFYDDGDPLTTGESDLAFITDFNASRNTIQLKGSAELYILDFFTSESGTIDADLIYDPGVSARGEVIATLQDVSPELALTTSVRQS